MGQLYAVVVGVADYQNDDGSVIVDLPGDDVIAARTAGMLEQLWGEGAHVRLLTKEGSSRSAIQEAIARMGSQSTRNDTVLLWFIGHGDEDWLLPYDALPTSYAVDISAGTLGQWLDGLQSSRVLVVLDSCEAGGYAERLSQRDRSILASCAADEYSHTNTPLSDYIALGLSQPEQMDTDADCRISVEEIYTYLGQQRIPGQTPQLVDGYDGELELLSMVTQ
jgi:hypothetical protein